MHPNIKQLITLLFNTSRLIKEKGPRNKNINSFSYRQLGTLQYIHDQKQVTMKQIAEYLCITAPSTTSLINTLVRLKQIKRIVGKKDRRVIKLEITCLGKETLNQGIESISERISGVLKHLSDKEITNFVLILEKLHKIYS